MIDREGNVRVMDFGIARRAGGSDLTTTGMMAGTPHYMSPEQASGETPDQRADIWDSFSFSSPGCGTSAYSRKNTARPI